MPISKMNKGILTNNISLRNKLFIDSLRYLRNKKRKRRLAYYKFDYLGELPCLNLKIKTIKQMRDELKRSIEDMPPEFNSVIDENFFDLF